MKAPAPDPDAVRLDPAAAGPAATGWAPHGFGPRRFGPRLHHLLFIAFTLIAAAPIAVLAFWASNTSFQNELDSVRERHLLVARNLTSTMSRYVRDVKAAFGLAIDSGALTHPIAGHPIAGLTDLLSSLNVIHVCIVGPDGTLQASLAGLAPEAGQLPPLTVLAALTSLAAATPNQIALSPLYHEASGQPVFYLVRRLPDDRLAVGVLATTYLVSLQQAIAFGDHGYAVIVDSKGQVIAHPFKDWVTRSRDISGVPVVAAMMRGETGVGEFYSPAFNGDMIAGYAVVPETGWGVMVPQPISELRRRASQVNQLATVIAVLSFIASALLAWLAALYLARPVRTVAATAEAVLLGNDEVAVPEFRGLVPREIRQLGAGFNTMLQALRLRAAEASRALREAQTSNAAKSQFLANMSHEIRTPLNGVVGMIELMQMTELTPAQRRHVETAAQSSQSLLHLIDDILDLSRIEAGRLQLVSTPFHLPAMLHDLRLLFAEQARSKGLSLLISVPDDLNLMFAGDRHRLQQILTNLVSNAIKFTAEGTVTVRCLRQQEGRFGLTVRFEVTDTGIGIPASKQHVIFDAFTQADNSMTRRYGGTGLGLSIARQLVSMMHGEIGVESSVGVGSTFWFRVVLERCDEAVPQAAPQPTQAWQSAPPAGSGGPGARPAFVSPAGREFQAALESQGRASVTILLVEDNPANLRVTQALLETLGCQVATAMNGLEAVSAYREQRYDLVLMDCQMPEMDGYEATRTIRQLEAIQHRRTPIIALTAHAMEGSRETALQSGMDDQITKPLTMAILSRKLLQWLAATETSPT